MKIINTSEYPRYVCGVDQTLAYGQTSAEVARWDIVGILKSAISACSPGFVRLSDEERQLVDRLVKLDEEGRKWVPKTFRPVDRVKEQFEADRPGREALAKAVAESAMRVKSINDETTYSTERDRMHAKDSASKIRGEVVAKKLASTGGEGISLMDLMGDNRFIEEHLKDSKISMDVSNTEGWRAPAPESPDETPDERPALQEAHASGEEAEETPSGQTGPDEGRQKVRKGGKGKRGRG